MRSKIVDTLHISPLKHYTKKTNLLYLEHEGKAHYMLMKDFDKLMFAQHSENN